MRVIIQKPDLDTCLAALILGVSERDDIAVVMRQAPETDLNGPDVYCIETGGSGQVHLNNFDHHDRLRREDPPACRQAYEARKLSDAKLYRLVEYVCMVDVPVQKHPPIPFPSLSNIFSGMLFLEGSPLKQFLAGLEILKKVLARGIDPFETMPDLREWRSYRKEKEENNKRYGAALQNAVIFHAQSGKKIGFGESTVIGDFQDLRDRGCDVVILYNPEFGEQKIRRFTISGNNCAVECLIPFIDRIETGWGGNNETILCSPRDRSSNLSKDVIIELVKEYL